MIIGARHVNGYLKTEQHIHQTDFTTTAFYCIGSTTVITSTALNGRCTTIFHYTKYKIGNALCPFCSGTPYVVSKYGFTI